jgi:hypothetical protein
VRAFAVILLAIGLVGALAASLDHVGVFDELAAVAARSRHVVGALWILAALVVALLNLPMLLLTGSLAACCGRRAPTGPGSRWMPGATPASA